jgi:hypothetical protein
MSLRPEADVPPPTQGVGGTVVGLVDKDEVEEVVGSDDRTSGTQRLGGVRGDGASMRDLPQPSHGMAGRQQ